LPPAGHIRATISGSKVIVDYVQALLPKDEEGGLMNAEVAYSYIITKNDGSNPSYKPYDVNNDGVINLSDLSMAVSSFGKIGDNLIADVNKDPIQYPIYCPKSSQKCKRYRNFGHQQCQ